MYLGVNKVRYISIKKAIGLVIAVAFLLNNTFALADVQHSELAPELWLSRPESREEYLAFFTRRGHEIVNNYIKSQIPPEGIMALNPEEKKIKIMVDDKVEWQKVLLVPIPGLFKHTKQFGPGQFGHIGLGNVNDIPVIYIDKENFSDHALRLHEMEKIAAWEGKRREMHLSYREMRNWITDPATNPAARKFSWDLDTTCWARHDISHLYGAIKSMPPKYIDFDNRYAIYFDEGFAADDADINIAAHKRGAGGQKEEITEGKAREEITEGKSKREITQGKSGEEIRKSRKAPAARTAEAKFATRTYKGRTPIGTPAQLLREMRAEAIYSEADAKTSLELSDNVIRDGKSDSRITIRRELKVLLDLGLVRQAGVKYYLAEWLRSLSDEQFQEFTKDAGLNKASPVRRDLQQTFSHILARVNSSQIPHDEKLKFFIGILMRWSTIPDKYRPDLSYAPRWSADNSRLGKDGVTVTPEICGNFSLPDNIRDLLKDVMAPEPPLPLTPPEEPTAVEIPRADTPPAVKVEYNIIFTESESDKRILELRKTDALLLPTGDMLVSEQLKGNELKIDRAIIHEEIEALMQMMEYSADPNKRAVYEKIKQDILSRKKMIASYKNLFGKDGWEDHAEPYLRNDLMVNDIIARAFEYDLLGKSNVSYYGLSYNEKPFVSLTGAFIYGTKDKYFGKEFWGAGARKDAIEVALGSGFVFDQAAGERNNEVKSERDTPEGSLPDIPVSPEVTGLMEKVIRGDSTALVQLQSKGFVCDTENSYHAENFWKRLGLGSIAMPAEIRDSDPHLRSELSFLKSILMESRCNLHMHARKFGAIPTIQTMFATREIVVSGMRGIEVLCLDNGPGMPVNFDPAMKVFTTRDDPFAGRGLTVIRLGAKSGGRGFSEIHSMSKDGREFAYRFSLPGREHDDLSWEVKSIRQALTKNGVLVRVIRWLPSDIGTGTDLASNPSPNATATQGGAEGNANDLQQAVDILATNIKERLRRAEEDLEHQFEEMFTPFAVERSDIDAERLQEAIESRRQKISLIISRMKMLLTVATILNDDDDAYLNFNMIDYPSFGQCKYINDCIMRAARHVNLTADEDTKPLGASWHKYPVIGSAWSNDYVVVDLAFGDIDPSGSGERIIVEPFELYERRMTMVAMNWNKVVAARAVNMAKASDNYLAAREAVTGYMKKEAAVRGNAFASNAGTIDEIIRLANVRASGDRSQAALDDRGKSESLASVREQHTLGMIRRSESDSESRDTPAAHGGAERTVSETLAEKLRRDDEGKNPLLGMMDHTPAQGDGRDTSTEGSLLKPSPGEFTKNLSNRYIDESGNVRYPVLGYWLPAEDDIAGLLAQIERVLQTKDTVTVADFGIGTGFLPLYIAEQLRIKKPQLSARVRFLGIERNEADINFFRARLGLEKIKGMYVRDNVSITIGDIRDASKILKDATGRATADIVISSWMPNGENFTPFIEKIKPALVVFARSTDPDEACGTSSSFTIKGFSEIDSWRIKTPYGKSGIVTVLRNDEVRSEKGAQEVGQADKVSPDGLAPNGSSSNTSSTAEKLKRDLDKRKNWWMGGMDHTQSPKRKAETAKGIPFAPPTEDSLTPELKGGEGDTITREDREEPVPEPLASLGPRPVPDGTGFRASPVPLGPSDLGYRASAPGGARLPEVEQHAVGQADRPVPGSATYLRNRKGKFIFTTESPRLIRKLKIFRKILREAVQIIQKEPAIEEMYLVGSFSNGTLTTNSDLDIRLRRKGEAPGKAFSSNVSAEIHERYEIVRSQIIKLKKYGAWVDVAPVGFMYEPYIKIDLAQLLQDDEYLLRVYKNIYNAVYNILLAKNSDIKKSCPVRLLETLVDDEDMFAKALSEEGVAMDEANAKTLLALGVLVQTPAGYRFSEMMRSAKPNDTATFINAISRMRYRLDAKGEERPLWRSDVSENIDLVRELVKMTVLHEANRMMKPIALQGKVLWHILETNVLAEAQKSPFAKITEEYLKSDASERIYILRRNESIANAVESIRGVCPDAVIDAALSEESHISSVPDNIKMLVFEGGAIDFRQIDGILLALKALHLRDEERLPALRHIYEMLNKGACDWKPQPIPIADPGEFARQFKFRLPSASRIPPGEVSRVNECLRKLLTAA